VGSRISIKCVLSVCVCMNVCVINFVVHLGRNSWSELAVVPDVHTFPLFISVNNLLIYISLSYKLHISPFTHFPLSSLACCVHVLHSSPLSCWHNYHYPFQLSMISVLSKAVTFQANLLCLSFCFQVVHLYDPWWAAILFHLLRRVGRVRWKGYLQLCVGSFFFSLTWYLFLGLSLQTKPCRLCFLSVEFANLNHTLRNIECWL